MSLDVYLSGGEAEAATGIFIREAGATREITRAEWDERFPGSEPVTATSESDELFWRNITHNLTPMADAAEIYSHLWRPEELGIETAGQLIEPLTLGLKRLRSDPEKFRTFNPPNGWGSYEGLVDFVAAYLAACVQHPAAKIRVSR